MTVRIAGASWMRSGAEDAHLSGLRDLAAGAVAGVFYATTRPGGAGVSALQLEAGGGLRRIDSAELPGSAIAGADSALLAVATPAGPRLFVDGVAPYGVWSFATAPDGALDGAAAAGPDLPADITALHAVEIAGESHLYGARAGQARIEHWGLDAAGRLTGHARHAAGTDAGAAGIVDLTDIAHGGRVWLLAATTGRDALVVYGLDAQGGVRLAEREPVGAGLGIAGPTALVTARVDGKPYAVLAAAGSGTLSVFTAGAGGIVATDHVMDSRATRFAGATTLETAEIAGATYLAAAGADDGLSLFQLLPGGRLLHLGSFADAPGIGLADITALALGAAEDGLGLVAASEDAPGVTTLQLPLGPAGRTLTAPAAGGRREGGAGDDVLTGGRGADDLRGGAGDDILRDGAGADILRGGEGADTFVFDSDGVADRIGDFEPGRDRIDLSGWAFLRNAGQLEIRSTASGATIAFGDEELRLDRAGGGAISAAEILAGDPIPLDRMLPGWLDGLEIAAGGAGAGGDTDGPGGGEPGSTGSTGGTGGGETGDGAGAAGGSGSPGGTGETGSGGTGAAGLRRSGGPRSDALEGGAGHDTLTGEGGADTLRGGAGNDRLDGGRGPDLLIGGPGSDILRVDHPDDRVIERGAWAGRDHVLSAVDIRLTSVHVEEITLLPGQARVAVGNGLDNVLRGNGRDNLLDGGGGADTLRGGAGDDTFVVRDRGDRVVEAPGEGADTVKAFVTHALAAGVEKLLLMEARDDAGRPADLNGIGNGLGNAIVGNAGDNRLIGRDGRDVLRGKAGADEFVFDRRPGPDNVDRIVDFQPGTDVMLIKAGLFGLAPHAWRPGEFRAGAAARDADDHLLYDRATGAVRLDPDGTGPAPARLAFLLDNRPRITIEDVELF